MYAEKQKLASAHAVSPQPMLGFRGHISSEKMMIGNFRRLICWRNLDHVGPRRYSAVKYCYERSNREPLPPGWDWAANSLQKASPPPLIRGTCTGPPTPITTIGEARNARRQHFLEARASEEACSVHAAQDTTQETSKGEVNTMAIVNPSSTTNVEGAEKGAPQTKANT